MPPPLRSHPCSQALSLLRTPMAGVPLSWLVSSSNCDSPAIVSFHADAPECLALSLLPAEPPAHHLDLCAQARGQLSREEWDPPLEGCKLELTLIGLASPWGCDDSISCQIPHLSDFPEKPPNAVWLPMSPGWGQVLPLWHMEQPRDYVPPGVWCPTPSTSTTCCTLTKRSLLRAWGPRCHQPC